MFKESTAGFDNGSIPFMQLSFTLFLLLNKVQKNNVEISLWTFRIEVEIMCKIELKWTFMPRSRALFSKSKGPGFGFQPRHFVWKKRTCDCHRKQSSAAVSALHRRCCPPLVSAHLSSLQVCLLPRFLLFHSVKVSTEGSGLSSGLAEQVV